jgi:hypothetical protein
MDLLLYHVLGDKVFAPYDALVTYPTLNYSGEFIDIANGAGLFPTINRSARIDTKDVCASNGVVHVINKVLTPASVTNNIVDIAVGSPDGFSTLVTALNAAGLIGALEGAGPFTVFGELFLCQLIFPFTYHILLHMIYSKIIFSSPLSIALTQSPDRRSICRFTWWNPRQLAPTSEYS